MLIVKYNNATHRGHSQEILKGTSIKAMMVAEKLKEKYIIDVAIIDPRIIVLLGIDLIVKSIKKLESLHLWRSAA